ncbi:MAG: pilus assembly protein [Pseudomonadota bacterium]
MGKTKATTKRGRMGRAYALAHRFVRRYRRDEDGTIVVIALLTFLLMVIMGGVAIDIARMEFERTKVQQTVDRAVLAAANLNSTQDPKEVVESYFEASGLKGKLGGVTVQNSLNGKTVYAQGDSEIATMFMHMVGIESLAADSDGGAQERVTDVEISLVVDISGSMGWDNADGTESKLDTLKSAAEIFFDEVIAEQTDETGITAVSVIPYNDKVIAGEELLSYFNTTDWHEETSCLRFYDDDFLQRQLSRTLLVERLGYFHAYGNSYNQPAPANAWCPVKPAHEILPFQTDKQTLVNFVNALDDGGGTAIDNGVKWAAALLDPDARDIVNGMIANESVDGIIQNWPREYGEEDTMKVVVLMTDGENTTQYDLKQDVKTLDGWSAALSDVYYSDEWGASEARDGFLVRFPDNDDDEEWYRPRSWWTTGDDVHYHDDDIPDDLIRLTYQQLYLRFTTTDAANYLYRYSDPGGYWYWSSYYERYMWAGVIPPQFNKVAYPWDDHDIYEETDERLENICDAIKDEEIIIFSIAFEAPQAGEDVMKYCASSTGHYYNVNGTDLEAAFTSIASQINHLKLIQ